MEHSANALLTTTVLCLFTAFAGGLAARAAKLPVLLGYLLAGIVVGPFTPGLTADQGITSDLAEIGVTLLLFNVGLHFSLKDLFAVRKVAVPGALVQIAASVLLGAGAAKAFLDIPWAEACLVGLGLSIASTAISTRLLKENRQMATFAGRSALGWLIVQDMAVIFAMVLFPVFFGDKLQGQDSLAKNLGKTFLQLLGFVIAIFVGARQIVPRLLIYVARSGSRELLTLGIIVTALGVAYGASVAFGVSLALGAFFAGIVIGESDLNHHAAAEILSMQQIFTIFFFVSAGMLFNPATLVHMPLQIFALWAVIVVSMGGVTTAILIAARVSPIAAATVGGAFSQIGEFSFVLAQTGRKWGILSDQTRDLILATAVVSIVLSPLSLWAFRRAGAVFCGLPFIQKRREDKLPKNVILPASGHAILIGFDRIGKIVSAALRENSIETVVIESDRKKMEAAKKLGFQAVFGDAWRETVLSAVHPETASLLILTISEGPQARRVIQLARKLNPSLRLIARVTEDAEARFMEKHEIDLAVMGEKEVAFKLSSFALRYFKIEQEVVETTIDRMRAQGASAS